MKHVKFSLVVYRGLNNMPKSKGNRKKYYVVVSGFKPGIYNSYTDVLHQITNYPNPIHKSFTDYKDASTFFFNGKYSSDYEASQERQSAIVAKYINDGTKKIREKEEITGSGLSFMNEGDSSSEPMLFLNNVSNSSSVFNVFDDVIPGPLRRSTRKMTQPPQYNSDDYYLADFEKLLMEEIERSIENDKLKALKSKEQNKKSKIEKPRLSDFGSSFNKHGIPIIYTDGCCLYSGSKEGRKAGCGVYWGEKDARNMAERLWGDQTNQRAELWAVIRGAQSALQSGYEEIEIRTDSSYVINAMTNWIFTWKKNGFKSSNSKPVKNRELFMLLDSLCFYITIHFVKVKSHSHDVGNDNADTLAKYGAYLESQVDPNVKPSFRHNAETEDGYSENDSD